MPGTRLQEEGALPGLADRARHEALGRVEAVDDGHGVEPRGCAKLGTGEGPAPPPTTASLGALAPSALAGLGSQVRQRPGGRSSW